MPLRARLSACGRGGAWRRLAERNRQIDHLVRELRQAVFTRSGVTLERSTSAPSLTGWLRS